MVNFYNLKAVVLGAQVGELGGRGSVIVVLCSGVVVYLGTALELVASKVISKEVLTCVTIDLM